MDQHLLNMCVISVATVQSPVIQSPVSREHTMDTVITMGELVIALAALGVISKAVIGRLGELGMFQRSELQQQA